MQNFRQDLPSSIVAGAERRSSILADNDLEIGKWRVAEEAFVEINVNAVGMINCEELYLVKIIDLFHRLAKTKAQAAIARPDAGALDFYVLSWIGKVGLAGSDPVADDCRPDHIGDKFKFFAVPGEQYGTRAATAIDLSYLLPTASRPFDLILYYSGGPEHPHYISLGSILQAGEHLRRALRKISGAGNSFPFLLDSSGIDFNLCADGALVVVQSMEGQANPGVAVSAVISKQDRIAAILGDEQISVAVLVEIAGEQCPRMLQLDLVQAGRVGHIFKALRPAIAKQPNLAALFSFTDRGDVNPSVIVIIQSGQTKAPNPVELWQDYPLELASAKVAPQAEAGR